MPRRKKKYKVDGSNLTDEDAYFLKELSNHQGWEVLKAVIKQNVDLLGEEILENNEDYSETSIRIMAKLREWQKALPHLPLHIANSILNKEEGSSGKLDPYFDTIDEIKKHEKEKQS